MKLSDLSSLILLVLVLFIPAAVEAQNGQKVRGAGGVGTFARPTSPDRVAQHVSRSDCGPRS